MHTKQRGQQHLIKARLACLPLVCFTEHTTRLRKFLLQFVHNKYN